MKREPATAPASLSGMIHLLVTACALRVPSAGQIEPRCYAIAAAGAFVASMWIVSLYL
jgi:hypothetical protein